MATLAEIAERQAARKLRQAGLNPDGSDPKDQRRGRAAEDDQHLEDDDQNLDDDGQNLDDDDQNLGDDGKNRDGDNGEELREELRRMREEMNALKGRLAPAQQDLEDLRRVASTQREQLDSVTNNYERQIAELQEQLNQRADAAIDPAEFLTEDERAELDPSVLKAVGKIAAGLARKAAAPRVDARAAALQVVQEQEQNRIKQYRNRLLTDPARGLHKLHTLANDQRFLAWTEKDDNEVDSVVRSLLAATSTEEIDRYARILQRKLSRYQEEQKDPASRRNNPAAGRTSLSNAMRRNPGKQLTDAEVQKQLSEARRLARSSRAEDRAAAQKILDSLQ